MSPTGRDIEPGSETHEDRLLYAIWVVHRTLLNVLDEELKPLHLTISQYGTLYRLVAHGPMSTADLARTGGLRPQTVAPIVSALLKAGLLQRRRHPVHKRVALIELTDHGRQTWQDADKRVAAIERRLSDTLGQQAHQAMRRDAWKITTALNGLPDEAGAGPLWPVDRAPHPSRSGQA